MAERLTRYFNMMLFLIFQFENHEDIIVTVGDIFKLDNYLIVFDIVARKEMVKWFKKFMKHTILYIIIAAIAVINFKYMYIL